GSTLPACASLSSGPFCARAWPGVEGTPETSVRVDATRFHVLRSCPQRCAIGWGLPFVPRGCLNDCGFWRGSCLVSTRGCSPGLPSSSHGHPARFPLAYHRNDSLPGTLLI